MDKGKNTDIADAAERARALDPAQSFIVQAPAGSGKTELLMQRYLSLLSTVACPEEILAVTFTKKAAGEMQGRIIGSLEKARSNETSLMPHEAMTIGLAEKVLKRDAELGWMLLENPGRLKVQTIDSFSANLTRQMPILSRAGSSPAVSDNPEELYIEAARRTVMLVSEEGVAGKCVEAALKHLDNSVFALVTRLALMLERRDQWTRHMGRAKAQDFRGVLETSLQDLVVEKLRCLRAAFPEELVPAVLKTAAYAATHLIEKGGASPITRLAGIDSLPGTEPKDLPLWQGVAAFLLTLGGTWRKPFGVSVNIGFPPAAKGSKGIESVMKDEFKGLLEALSGNAELCARLGEAVILPNPEFDDRDWEILDALLKLLPIADGFLQDVFTETGTVDFTSVALSSLNSLGSEDDPTDLLLTLDYRIKHILVDEYQDTSYAQLKLLRTLTAGWERDDGRTLFLVGDPMQSIFGFREAEVGLFLSAKNAGVGNLRPVPLTLKTNFRSEAGIIDWVNKTFAWAFPTVEDQFTGAVSFEPSIAFRGPSGNRCVEMHLSTGRDDAFEAERAVSIIKGIPAGETVAILCRSRAHLEETIKLLKREGMGFRARGLDPLSERPVIYDLTSLLRALSHPYDRTAWLSILRAPWLGLALKDIHALCAGRKDAPVWSLLNDPAHTAALPEDARARLVPFVERLKKALELKGRVPPAGLVEGLWIALGGPACVEPGDLKDAETFFETLSRVSSGGSLDPSKDLQARIAALRADHGGDAGIKLDLMTIHNAKGLEFDHVIIPGLGKRTRGEEKKLLIWMERGDDLLLAPVEKKTAGESSPVYDYLRAVVKKKSEFERRRLFYVAATRAKKGLHIIGHVRQTSEEGGVRVEPSSFLAGIEDLIPRDALRGPLPEADQGEVRPLLRLKRLPASWALPAPAAPAPVAFDATAAAPSGGPEFYWAGEAVRHLGTVVHRYLCRIGKDGVDEWDGQRVRGEKGRIRAALLSLGLNRVEADKKADDAGRIIAGALNDARLKWILKDRKEGAFEYALTAVLDGEIVRSVIDRTFVDEDDVRWVIDYKTGLHEGAAVEEFLKAEAERYGPQLERYAAVLAAAGEKRLIKKALYYPALLKWVEL